MSYTASYDPHTGKPFPLDAHVVDVVVKIDGKPIVELSTTTVSQECRNCDEVWTGNIQEHYEAGMMSLHFGNVPGGIAFPETQPPKHFGLWVETEFNQGLWIKIEKQDVVCDRCGEDVERGAPHTNLGLVEIKTKGIDWAMDTKAQLPERRGASRPDMTPPPCERNCLVRLHKDLEEMDVEWDQHIAECKLIEEKIEGLPADQRRSGSAILGYLIYSRNTTRKWLEDNEKIMTDLNEKLLTLRKR